MAVDLDALDRWSATATRVRARLANIITRGSL
jgi:hypothetical protein